MFVAALSSYEFLLYGYAVLCGSKNSQKRKTASERSFARMILTVDSSEATIMAMDSNNDKKLVA
jgi:hypothetical protein